VNVPLTAGYGDGEFMGIYQRILMPIALEFKPELILVSAGFDIYYGDPLGGMNVTPTGFAGMARAVMDIADECCKGKAVLTLEGGYDLEGQRESVKQVLKELAGVSKTDTRALMATAEAEMLDYLVERVKRTQRQYWKYLSS
jgi:acetoin utilization deacetylase AcuC-like enzyme